MDNVIIPKDFTEAVADIKLAILQARSEAARTSNKEALKLYFFVGGYLVENENCQMGDRGYMRSVEATAD